PWITRSDPVDSSTIKACNGELDKELDFASLRMLEIPPPSSLSPCQVVTRQTKEGYVVSTVHTNDAVFYEYPADCLTSLFLLIMNKHNRRGPKICTPLQPLLKHI